MNFILSYLVILVTFPITTRFLKSEHLRPDEMKQVLSLVDIYDVPQQCSLALEGKFYPEIKYTYMYCRENLIVYNKPELDKCTGFDCWESQLTDVTRFEIVNIMNRYRQRVANNTCSKWCTRNDNRIIFQLSWDHMLEENATQILKTCPQKLDTSDSFYDSKAKNQVNRDTVVTSFQTRTGLQREMRLILGRLITENHLKDWNEDTHQFKRAHMVNVGCAYVLRRRVNYVTALNEMVKSGNVGHLACIFTFPVINPKEPHGTPSAEECAKSSGFDKKNIEFSEKNYYPLLCKWHIPINKEIIRTVPQSCQPDPNRNVGQCPQSDMFSVTTWKEKYYGMIVKIQNDQTLEAEAVCNVPNDLPKPETQGSTIDHYCTKKYEVFVDADPVKCSGWNCQDSQLTDFTRIDILNRLNQAREWVAISKHTISCPPPDCEYPAKGAFKYCNMAKVKWHWFLEWKASEFVRQCPDFTPTHQVEIDDGPFPDPVFSQVLGTAFYVPTSEGQSALAKTFEKLFWSQFLYDFNHVSGFNRANALWIGCSIVMRPDVEIPLPIPELEEKNATLTHMVCLYAALDSDFDSKHGSPNDQSCCQTCTGHGTLTNPCPVKTVKNIPPYANLCTSVLPEITMSCQACYCEGGCFSKAWLMKVDGMSYEDVDGSIHSFDEHANGYFNIILLSLLTLLSALLLSAGAITVIKRNQNREDIKKSAENIKSTPKAIVEKKPTTATRRTLPTTRITPKLKPSATSRKPLPSRPTITFEPTTEIWKQKLLTKDPSDEHEH